MQKIKWFLIFFFLLIPCGLMDKALDFYTEKSRDCEFDPHLGSANTAILPTTPPHAICPGHAWPGLPRHRQLSLISHPHVADLAPQSASYGPPKLRALPGPSASAPAASS